MRKKEFDTRKHVNDFRGCFICEGKVNPEEIIYEDERHVAFLDAYPPTKGYTVLAVKKHLESATELSEQKYLELQKILYRIAQAIQKAFNPKRIIVMQTGGLILHLHFHIIPIYENYTPKQFLDYIILKKDILELSEKEKSDIIELIKNNL